MLKNKNKVIITSISLTSTFLYGCEDVEKAAMEKAEKEAVKQSLNAANEKIRNMETQVDSFKQKEAQDENRTDLFFNVVIVIVGIFILNFIYKIIKRGRGG